MVQFSWEELKVPVRSPDVSVICKCPVIFIGIPWVFCIVAKLFSKHDYDRTSLIECGALLILVDWKLASWKFTAFLHCGHLLLVDMNVFKRHVGMVQHHSHWLCQSVHREVGYLWQISALLAHGASRLCNFSLISCTSFSLKSSLFRCTTAHYSRDILSL